MTALTDVAAIIVDGARWIRLGLETLGAVTIAVGAVATLIALARDARDFHVSFTAVRLTLARYLTLALEFQLAADILETAMSPEWQTIAELAAIAAIRTALNCFLSREIREERQAVA
ncbi:MAG: DUF1622 domain-containing protein, partial [bacterium]